MNRNPDKKNGGNPAYFNPIQNGERSGTKAYADDRRIELLSRFLSVIILSYFG